MTVACGYIGPTPLHSCRLTLSHLKQLTVSLKLTISRPPHQLLEGLLELEKDVEVSTCTVQTFIQESQFLISDEGVFLDCNQTKESLETELEHLQETLAKAKVLSLIYIEVAAAKLSLEDKEKSARLMTPPESSLLEPTTKSPTRYLMHC